MKILISTSTFGKFDRKPIEKLEEKGYEVILNTHGKKLTKEQTLELAKDCSGIIAGTEIYDSEILGKLNSLKIISRVGIGLDSIDLKKAKMQGVSIYKTPDGPTQAVSELALNLILTTLRRTNLMDGEIRTGIWNKRMGRLLSGKTIGIIGLGRIGKRLAQLISPFNCKVVASDPFPDKEWAEENEVNLCSLDDLLRYSDVVSLHIPYTPENQKILDAKKLSLMKNTAILVNTSRGGLIDEEALYDCLQNKRLGGAALDVMELEPYTGPLKELNNTVLTPHVGSYAQESRIMMETNAVENLIKYFEGGE